MRNFLSLKNQVEWARTTKRLLVRSRENCSLRGYLTLLYTWLLYKSVLDVVTECPRRLPYSAFSNVCSWLSPSSETQGLLVGTMRYFRASDIFGAEVYFTGWRAPGHFFWPNEFQKYRNPSRWLARKFFSGQSTRRSSRVILSPFYTKWFSSGIAREDSHEEFKKKRFDEAEEIANRNMGARRCVRCNLPIVPMFGRHNCVARATVICISWKVVQRSRRNNK